jgi:hypothetical protein
MLAKEIIMSEEKNKKISEIGSSLTEILRTGSGGDL